MLKKLLKYDFKAVLKLWWIAAAASVLLTLAGGMCIRILDSDRNIPEIVQVVASLGLVLVLLSWAAFGLISTIIIFARFYKNFFTDEGYLTFTLPVSRGKLLNSKLIVLTVTNIMSAAVIFFDIFLLFAVGAEGFFPEFIKPMFEGIKELGEFLKEQEALWWVILYIVEALVILLLSNIFSILFLTSCITFGSIVAKKAKVITSIAIYYFANNVFSFAVQIFFMFGLQSLSTWLSGIDPEPQIGFLIIAMLIFCVIAIMGLLCSLLYTLQYWMLDRKLNLA